jgi:hypothetical protein
MFSACFLYPTALTVLAYEWRNPLIWIAHAVSLGGLAISVLSVGMPNAHPPARPSDSSFNNGVAVWILGLAGAASPTVLWVLESK